MIPLITGTADPLGRQPVWIDRPTYYPPKEPKMSKASDPQLLLKLLNARRDLAEVPDFRDGIKDAIEIVEAWFSVPADSLLRKVRPTPVADDAVYVTIAPYAVAKTEEIVPGRVFFDRCSHGHIIGVEVIGGKVEQWGI
jgi:uncharacterized protein YuzE